MAPITRSMTRLDAQRRQQTANVTAAARGSNRAFTRSMTRQARMVQQAANIAAAPQPNNRAPHTNPPAPTGRAVAANPPPPSASLRIYYRAIQVFRLMDLPLELADAVFRHTLYAGDAAMMRTSNLVYERSKLFLPTNGVFHIRAQEERGVDGLGSRFHVQPLSLPSQTAAMASHVHIDLKLRLETRHLANNFGCLQTFTGALPQRETCRIVLSSSISGQEHREAKPINLLSAFKNLVGFEIVAVEVVFNALPKGNATKAMLRGPVLRARNRPLYETFRRELEPTLGPAEWKYGDVQGGRYLEFFPRRHADSLVPIEEEEECLWS